MSSMNPLCSTLSVTRLEDRTNPIAVTNPAWNAALPGTLPHAIALANATAGVDVITFDWTVLGNTPVFNSNAVQEVKEGVVIQAGGGANYITIKGDTPFYFTHNKPGIPAAQKESEIRGGVFQQCQPPVAAALKEGGAFQVLGGQVTTFNTRFTGNTANNGGAVHVAEGATLVLDGDLAQAPPDITPHPATEEGGGPPDPNGYPAQGGTPKTLFQWNTAGTDGGAIENNGTVILKRVVFNLNTAANHGGAIDNNWGTTAKLTVPVAPTGTPQSAYTEVTIMHNTALRGGGVMFKSSATSDLVGVNVNWNNALTDGGGFCVFDGTVNLTGSAVDHNSATGKGGAIYIVKDVANSIGSPTVELWGVTFGFNAFSAAGSADLDVSTGGTLFTHGCALSGDSILATSTGGGAPVGTFTPDPMAPNSP